MARLEAPEGWPRAVAVQLETEDKLAAAARRDEARAEAARPGARPMRGQRAMADKPDRVLAEATQPGARPRPAEKATVVAKREGDWAEAARPGARPASAVQSTAAQRVAACRPRSGVLRIRRMRVRSK